MRVDVPFWGWRRRLGSGPINPTNTERQLSGQSDVTEPVLGKRQAVCPESLISLNRSAVLNTQQFRISSVILCFANTSSRHCQLYCGATPAHLLQVPDIQHSQIASGDRRS
jgi:hypothetical protein